MARQIFFWPAPKKFAHHWTRARGCVRDTTRDDGQRWGEETGLYKGRKVGSEIWVKGQGQE